MKRSKRRGKKQPQGNRKSVEAVEEIESRTGKPVVTSNQSSIWMTLRRLGHTQPIGGFGRLLRSLTHVPAVA